MDSTDTRCTLGSSDLCSWSLLLLSFDLKGATDLKLLLCQAQDITGVESSTNPAAAGIPHITDSHGPSLSLHLSVRLASGSSQWEPGAICLPLEWRWVSVAGLNFLPLRVAPWLWKSLLIWGLVRSVFCLAVVISFSRLW